MKGGNGNYLFCLVDLKWCLPKTAVAIQVLVTCVAANGGILITDTAPGQLAFLITIIILVTSGAPVHRDSRRLFFR